VLEAAAQGKLTVHALRGQLVHAHPIGRWKTGKALMKNPKEKDTALDASLKRWLRKFDRGSSGLRAFVKWLSKNCSGTLIVDVSKLKTRGLLDSGIQLNRNYYRSALDIEAAEEAKHAEKEKSERSATSDDDAEADSDVMCLLNDAMRGGSGAEDDNIEDIESDYEEDMTSSEEEEEEVVMIEAEAEVDHDQAIAELERKLALIQKQREELQVDDDDEEEAAGSG
jgi:hypothetical protein